MTTPTPLAYLKLLRQMTNEELIQMARDSCVSGIHLEQGERSPADVWKAELIRKECERRGRPDLWEEGRRLAKGD